VSVPSFLCETTADLELGGHTLRFYAVSAPVLFRLQAALGGPLAKLFSALYAGQAHDDALGTLLEAIGANSELAATLILDALHDEPWVKRPVTKAAVEEFLGSVGGPSLVAMLSAVVRVNALAFGPLAVGLLASAKASSPTETRQTSAGAI
jgi:hypothetical protein